ncbi:RICIN domain-containing protein [Kitasatospora sp. NPDC097691]|uniref:RICIN domain-containing protein n=1 Tax=Kitasatospora sp. NPDC097691 TaxID=3157231 RepID=UPI00331F75D3
MSSNGLRKHPRSAAGVGFAALTLALTALGGGQALAAPQGGTATGTDLPVPADGTALRADATGPINIRNSSGKCLEIENSSSRNGARAQQWTCNGQAGAVWRLDLVPEASNWYYIKNVHNGKCLEIENSSHQNGANAQLWSCNEQAGSKWQVVGTRYSGVYGLRNSSGKFLEIENSSAKNGARAQQWEDNHQTGVLWRF